jgi:Tfp pilus assembly protein PilV
MNLRRRYERATSEDEGGFTIIEVLIAAVVLVLGSLAVFLSFASAIHNVQRSREGQIAISVAQREMERVRVISYDSVALSSMPTVSTLTTNPNFRLKGTGAATEFNLKRTSGEEWRPVLTTGLVTPETTGVSSLDGTQVTVVRFVTCEEPGKTNTTCKAKRIVIDIIPVAKGNLANYKHSYYELQSTLVDPTP